VRLLEVLSRFDPEKARSFRRVLFGVDIVLDDPRVCLADVQDAKHARLAQGEQDDDSGVTGSAYLRDELRISRGLPTVKPSSAPSLLGADRSRASGRFSSRSPRLPPPPPDPRSLSPINARGSASRSLRSLHYDAARWERAPKSPPP